MAKLYRLELYVADYNDVYDDVYDLENCLQSGWGFDDVILNCFNAQETEVEWNDEIDLNYDSANKDIYDKYFKK